ncbi:hypothetical protein HKW67_10570 [Gemmatimonas groenlandica]|uniref:Uncharacterized protein n=1 Tax=Gemmatimonas groenlandica TaxID=2732249 RepID=A0A6M4IMM9_9BACT|nr:hypothetical protein HKW67_10570 [Gemmatimonas groenlandica]
MITSKRLLAIHRDAGRRVSVVLSAAVLLAAMTGCASKSASKSGDFGTSSVQTAVIQNAQGSATGINMVSTTEVNSVLINAPVEKAWAALQEAYASLTIPVTELNQQTRTIGNNAYRVRRRIGDVPTMRALDCGGDSGMPNAETYQLLLTVKSRIIPNDAGGSVVQTTLEGTGKNATTAASSDVRCSSMGALEKKIADLVKAKVAAK